MPTQPQGPAQGRAFYQSTRALPHQRMQVMEGAQGSGADGTEYIGAPPAVYGNAAASGAPPQRASAALKPDAGVSIKPHSITPEQVKKNA